MTSIPCKANAERLDYIDHEVGRTISVVLNLASNRSHVSQSMLHTAFFSVHFAMKYKINLFCESGVGSNKWGSQAG